DMGAFRSAQILGSYLIRKLVTGTLAKEKNVPDLVNQARGFVAEEIDSQRAFAVACHLPVDRDHRIVARLDRPVELRKVHQNIGLESAVPDSLSPWKSARSVRPIGALVSHQPKP